MEELNIGPMYLIKKTDIKIDLTQLLTEILKIKLVPEFDYQFGFTHRLNCNNKITDSLGSLYDYDKKIFTGKEKDFTEFNSDYKHTYFYELYKQLPFAIGRMRLMCLKPKTCLSMHRDKEIRYHIALITNEQCFIIYRDYGTYHIPADGYVYKMDATKYHTAINGHNSDDRIHLVMTEIDYD